MLRDESSCDGGSIVEKLESFVQGKDIPLFAPLGKEGGTPLYKLYRCVFLSHFGLKTGIDFDQYVLKSVSREP